MDDKLRNILDEKCFLLRKEGNKKVYHFVDVDFDIDNCFDFIKELSCEKELNKCLNELLGVRLYIKYQGYVFLIRNKN